MRSTNIMVFLVMLNAAAGLVTATGIGPAIGANPTVGGDQQIDQAEDEARSIASDRSALDNFVNGVISAATTLVTIFGIVIAAPLMFSNLGVPAVLVTFLFAPLYLFVGLDILQVISGRILS
ncbi:hypothetical protein [Halomarina rubra]|uniref:Uncharacterized protein n=1 Tax=Halomarina rubra TaxID=2071873 RepID=A0ABD6B241_9EURY|nr:hypothetical protein [Halomarina rubra]